MPNNPELAAVTFSLLDLERLKIPDHLRILLDTPITAEEAHPSDTRNALFEPSFLILVCFVDHFVRLDIAVEVVRHKVVITLIDDTVAESRKAGSVAELATLDGIENPGEVSVELEVTIVVGVAKIFHVFCQVSKEEDVGFADLAGDFDLSPCQ